VEKEKENAVRAGRIDFLIGSAYFAAIAALIWFCLTYVLSLVLPFLLGLAVALALRPAVEALSELLRVRRRPMAVALTVLLYVSLAGILCLTALFALRSARELLLKLPGFLENDVGPAVERVQSFLVRLGAARWLGELPEGGLSGLAGEMLPSLVERSAQLVSELPSAALTVTFTIVFSLLICADHGRVTGFLVRLIPEKHRRLLFDSKAVLKDGVAKLIGAHLLLMLINFALLLAAFLLLGAESPVGIAAVVALLDVLPLIGTGTVLIPWGAVELLRGNSAFGAGLLLTFAVTVAVRNLMEPKLVGKNTGLDPVAALFSMYVGWRLLGFKGVFIAPLALLLALRLHAFSLISTREKQKQGKEITQK